MVGQDLLRSMPDCLLMCENYSSWVEAADLFARDKNIAVLTRYQRVGIVELFLGGANKVARVGIVVLLLSGGC